MIRINPITTQTINKKIKKAFKRVTKKIVNKTCHIKIMRSENRHPIYQRLLLLLTLQVSHLQKKPCPFCLNISFT